MIHRYYPIMVVFLLLAACGRAERVDLAMLKNDLAAWQGKTLEVHGQVIEPSSHTRYISVGSARYFVLTDGMERMNIWYDASKLHCPPFPGSEITMVGKIKPAGKNGKLRFMAKSLEITRGMEPPEDTVRLCSLGYKESEIYAREGPDGLQKHWRRQGRPVLNITAK